MSSTWKRKFSEKLAGNSDVPQTLCHLQPQYPPDSLPQLWVEHADDQPDSLEELRAAHAQQQVRDQPFPFLINQTRLQDTGFLSCKVQSNTLRKENLC